MNIWDVLIVITVVLGLSLSYCIFVKPPVLTPDNPNKMTVECDRGNTVTFPDGTRQYNCVITVTP